MYEHYGPCCATFCFMVFGVAVVITVVVSKGEGYKRCMLGKSLKNKYIILWYSFSVACL